MDINSTLNISLDRDELQNKIRNLLDVVLPDDLSNKLASLVRVMENRNESLEAISSVVGTYDYESFRINEEKYDIYVSELQKNVSKLDDITLIDERIEEKALEFDDLYGSIYQAVEVIINELAQEIKSFTKNKGIQIQLGSWLVTRGKKVPLHLIDFDSIAPQNLYEVDRWQFIPSTEQLETLIKFEELARDNIKKADGIFRTIAKTHLKQLQRFGESEIKNIHKEVEKEINKNKSEGNIDLSLVIVFEDIEGLMKSADNFYNEINTRKVYYQNILSGDTFLIGELILRLKKDVLFVKKNNGRVLYEKINSVIHSISKLDNKSLNNLKDLCKDIKILYGTNFIGFRHVISDNLRVLFFGEKLDIASLTFSDLVKKMIISDLPGSTILDIKEAGVRKNGDLIVLKLNVFTMKDKIYEEDVKLHMFRILPHIKATVGVVFTDPLAHTDIKNKFQMAPHYNLIVKGLCDQKLRRKSVLYNKVFNWGAGFHLSAPDFDGNDIPEIGAGIVLSILNDYLQSGMAINMFTGDPYWFFGLRLPVDTYGIESLFSFN